MAHAGWTAIAVPRLTPAASQQTLDRRNARTNHSIFPHRQTPTVAIPKCATAVHGPKSGIVVFAVRVSLTTGVTACGGDRQTLAFLYGFEWTASL